MNETQKAQVKENLRARNGNCSRVREALLPEIAGEDLWGHGGRSLVIRRIGQQLGVPESTVGSVLYTSREYKDAVKARAGMEPHAKNGKIGDAPLLPQAKPASLPEETAALAEAQKAPANGRGDWQLRELTRLREASEFEDEPQRPKPPLPLSTTIKRSELEKLKEAAGRTEAAEKQMALLAAASERPDWDTGTKGPWVPVHQSALTELQEAAGRTAEAEELFYAAQGKVEELTAQVKRQETELFKLNRENSSLLGSRFQGVEKAKQTPAPREQNVEDNTRFLRAMPPREQCLALVGLFKREVLCKAARIANLIDGADE